MLLPEKTKRIANKKGLQEFTFTVTPFFLLMSFTFLLLFNGCEFQIGGKKKDEDKKETLAPVVVQPSWTGDISTYLRLNGVLEPEKEVQIYSRAVGQIVELSVEEGDYVKPGQFLARLDNKEQELSLARARTAVKREQALLQRAEKLFNKNLMAEDEFERIKLSLQDAELRLKQSELSYQYTQITAPFSGTIAERYINYGDRIDVARPLFKLVDKRTLHIDSWVAETDISKLAIGLKTILTTPAFPNHEFTAVLVRISPVVDPTYGKVKVTFEVSGRQGNLKPGQFIELRITLETHKNVQLIPKKALVYEAGVPVLFINQDSLSFRRCVKLGLKTGDLVEIISGIELGENVIVEGQATLRDSTRVKIVSKRMKDEG
ncbi:MAG: efflux RND transporter periplasmic adaptor subunit [Candidatus Hatepunaea meridiana]|nr:efflux RND transporter periplasmic adaptor subunit [Candidatus Hatepunaea meridiana]